MRRQRTIFQSARNINPPDAIRVQSKWPGSAESGYAHAAIQIVGSGGREILFEIGVIETGPFFFLFVPPDQLLAVAPWLAVRTGRRAVINDAAIVRPYKSPAMSKQIFGCALICAITVPFRIHAAIDPRAASGRTIIFQILYVRNLLVIGNGPAVNFLQYVRSFRLAHFTFDWIIPCKRIQPGIARPQIILSFLFDTPPKVIHEPGLTARVARRINRLLAILQQSLGVGEGSFFFGCSCRWE